MVHMTCDSASDHPSDVASGPENAEVAAWSWPPRVESIPQARAAVTIAAARRKVSAEVLDVLRIAVTELAANAVQHAAAVTEAVRVTLVFEGSVVRLDVADGSAVRPRRSAAVGAEDEIGRGLVLVRALAAEVGGRTEVIEHADGAGKTLRVELPVE